MLGGTVIEGQQRGRKIGFPTVNLQFHEPCKLLPANGVYVARVELDGVVHPAMMNVGRRPTVSIEGEVTVEAHILGYSGDLYGRVLSFSLLDFIREERRFASLDELQLQLKLDKNMVELYRD
jgi:riboflavin kinase/FMN adenylyltransferase